MSELKQELQELKKKLIDSQKEVKIITSKLDETSINLQEIDKENKANKTEIKRLRGLKWYDKLFGEK